MLIIIDFVQCTVLSKKSLSQPCPLQSSSCGREDAMVVFHSDAVKNQEGKDGRAEVLCLAAALDQEAMESAEDFHLAANRDQELYSISRESTVDVCITYTNGQVVYAVIIDCI